MNMLKIITLLVLSLTFSEAKRVAFQLHKHKKPLAQITELQGQSLPVQILAKSIHADLTNYQNLQYYGQLSIGTKKFPMNFVFDTGSNELWFPTSKCSTCQAGNNRYDTSTSTEFNQTSQVRRNITYGRGFVEGYPCEDQVWFTSSQKVDKMPCLAVDEQKDLNGIQADGILGLAPLEQAGQPPFLLQIMQNAGLIDRQALSLAYHGTDEQTTLVFGEPDLSLASGTSNATIPIVAKGILYFVSLTQASIGGKELGSSPGNALLDTGTSLTSIPEPYISNLLKYYNDKGANLQSCGENACGYCSDIDKSPFRVALGGHYFEIPFSELWINQGSVCILGAFASSGTMWIFGDNFLRNYFVILDYDAAEVTLVGNKISKVPTDYTAWIVVGVIAGVIIIVAIGCCIYYRCKRKRVPTDQNTLIQRNPGGVRLGSSAQEHFIPRQNV